MFMVFTSKIVFNIGGIIIHSMLKIHVQQSLSSLPNLSFNSLNMLTCWSEQLQFVVLDEISFVGAIMLNVISNRLKGSRYNKMTHTQLLCHVLIVKHFKNIFKKPFRKNIKILFMLRLILKNIKKCHLQIFSSF